MSRHRFLVRSLSLYAQGIRLSLTQKAMTLTEPGNKVTNEHIYRYNTGRFLVNEEYELAKRYSPFDIEALCRIVASLPSVSSPVSQVVKKEGGYNKALLMTAENGRMVIAKVPCRNIVPRQYGTASEVAVLRFVLAWSAHDDNPAHTEYIVLEPSPGRQLSEVWDELEEAQKSILVRKFAELESNLAAVAFPGYGSLYFRNALPAALQKSRHRTIDVDETYCLGPMYHGSWPGGFAADPEQYAQFSGPWKSLTHLAHDFVNQGIFQIEHYKSSYAGRGPHFGTPEEHIDTLHRAKQVMPLLTELPALQRHGGPVLCHPDFHPGNIFVCRQEPTRVDGIVDWQYANILPRFMNVRWPLFLTMGCDAEEAGQEDPKCEAQRRHEEAMRIKCYEAALVKSHMEPYLDLPEPDVAVRKLFTLCSDTYRDGILPIRDCLVKLFQYWKQLGLSKECPYHFSTAEIAQHERQWTEYQDWLTLRESTHGLLKSNDGGWIPPGVNFEETKNKHQLLYEHFIRTKMKDMPEEEARKLWFFRERG
ncbi:uncharacterized protein ACHE_60036A [Aspergillus chevalieri]|uniref:Altered inheritance of mitochondria protein 9, mitochondrial n=1 Tax=Aspergillus chevalieri TaxID=182096 RepID=A0A7R7VST9_ASPCH|nr:uncharacterized protein ACHE_60036A [Aspergillus chevalieri]BCR90150.1 hypothetical protein ACHE_60036A [Aspergillus chevalieri]